MNTACYGHGRPAALGHCFLHQLSQMQAQTSGAACRTTFPSHGKARTRCLRVTVSLHSFQCKATRFCSAAALLITAITRATMKSQRDHSIRASPANSQTDTMAGLCTSGLAANLLPGCASGEGEPGNKDGLPSHLSAPRPNADRPAQTLSRAGASAQLCAGSGLPRGTDRWTQGHSPGLSPGYSRLGTRSARSRGPQSQACRCSSHHSGMSGARPPPSCSCRLWSMETGQSGQGPGPSLLLALGTSFHPLPLPASLQPRFPTTCPQVGSVLGKPLGHTSTPTKHPVL